jgi:hypothetical protein
MTKKVLTSLLMVTFALTIPSLAPGQTNTNSSEPSVQDWQGLA